MRTSVMNEIGPFLEKCPSGFVCLTSEIDKYYCFAHCTKNDFQECIVGGQLNILSPKGWNEAFKSHFSEYNGPEYVILNNVQAMNSFLLNLKQFRVYFDSICRR